jgi:hypothetical protein
MKVIGTERFLLRCMFHLCSMINLVHPRSRLNDVPCNPPEMKSVSIALLDLPTAVEAAENSTRRDRLPIIPVFLALDKATIARTYPF